MAANTNGARVADFIGRNGASETRYFLLESLGSGGSGHAYKARKQIVTGGGPGGASETVLAEETILLKVLDGNQESEARGVQALRAAFPNRFPSCLAAVRSDVLEVRDSRRNDLAQIIEIELVAGCTLETMRNRGPIALPLVRRILLLALDAMEVLHQKMLVHRDASPSNWIYEDEFGMAGALRLIDCGRNRRISTTQGVVRTDEPGGGTAGYTVERDDGDPDTATDILALGNLLLFLLVGYGAMQRISYDDRSDLIRAGVPPVLADLILWMTQKRPGRCRQIADVRPRVKDAFARLEPQPWSRWAASGAACLLAVCAAGGFFHEDVASYWNRLRDVQVAGLEQNLRALAGARDEEKRAREAAEREKIEAVRKQGEAEVQKELADKAAIKAKEEVTEEKAQHVKTSKDFEGERARSQGLTLVAETARAEAKEERSKREEAEGRTEQAASDLAAANAALTEARNKVKDLEARLGVANAGLTAANDQVKALGAERDELSARVKSLGIEVARLKQEAQQTASDLTAARSALATAEGKVANQEKGLGAANAGSAPAFPWCTPRGRNAQGREEYVHDRTGILLVMIPAGEFMMGSPAAEPDRNSNETQHLVRISRPFLIGKYEVTQAQWRFVMDSNPSEFKNAGEEVAVENVSWEDAQEFCRKIGVALPTEAQWEYACRAGTTGAIPGSSLDAIAWHKGNSGGTTNRVGTRQPNAWGLHDMIGNVWEWCGDWYGDYPTGMVTDPQGMSSGLYRVLRGGSWSYDASESLRCAYRGRSKPGVRDYRWCFRVVVAGTP